MRSAKSVTPRSGLFLSLAIFAQVGSFWELATKESMGSKVQVFTEQCSQKDLELSELRRELIRHVRAAYFTVPYKYN